MRFDLTLVGGRVVTADRDEAADIGITDGRIAAIGDLATADTAERVSVRGLTLMPGVIDTQVHFREPGMEQKEDIESGTRAAVAGGVTTVFEMPNTIPPTTGAEALQDKLRRAEGRAWSNIAFFVGAGLDNLEVLSELETLPGTPGVKLFMGSSTGTLLVPDDDAVRKVLQNGRYRVAVHSEDHARLEARRELFPNPKVGDHPEIRDVECARLCTERLLRLARETGRPVHVLHLSTAEEIPQLRQARSQGVDVTVEITPQHLWFAGPEAYERLGTLAQMNPPIRTAQHRDALRKALRKGRLFDVIGSDHAPHTLEEKRQAYPKSPSGMPGVQTLLPVMLTLMHNEDLIDLPTLVRMTSETPARLYGIKDRGRIDVGMWADLVALDAEATYTFSRSMVQSKCGWSPFEGETLHGRIVHTIVNGGFAWREGGLGQPQGRIPEFDRP